MGETKVGRLHPLNHAANLHLLLAPVKLVGLAGCERQGNKGRRLGGLLFVVTDEALHAVVGALVAQSLQVFEELLGAAALPLGSLGIEVQPLGQCRLEFAQLRLGRLLAAVLGRLRRRLAKVLANGIAREACDFGDGTDGLAVHLMHAPYFQHGFHD